MMKAGVFRPTKLVSLRKVEALTAILPGKDGSLTIGAMTPLSVVEHSESVRAHAPVITQTLRTLSNVRVRNVATVGGHLAHADPHMDLPPVLVALGARVTVAGDAGERSLPVEDLFAGYFETVLARDELITELIVPAQGLRRAAYLKCTTRAVHDWPALGIAVSVESDGGVIRNASIVISAATETPTRLAAAETALRGGRAGDALFRQAGDVAVGEADLITDGQGSAAYKRELLRVHLVRALRAALGTGAH
jgi:carbon-monoxide dehydrogenase medium subunit